MRVLFTTQPALGHFHPLVPLARSLLAAGHDVAFASAAGFCSHIAADGFRSFPAGLDWREDSTFLDQVVQVLPEVGTMPPGPGRRDYVEAYFFAGVAGAQMVPDLLALQATWPADVIVRERFEYGGCVAAERIGIPHACVQVGALYPDADLEPLELSLARLRKAVTLPTDPDEVMAMLYRYLLLSPMPSSLQTPGAPLPPTLHAFCSTPFAGLEDAHLLDWWAKLQTLPTLHARPLVYATLGTVVNRSRELFGVILTALHEAPVTLMLTVGTDLDPGEFGPQPPHIHIERYIPQTQILSRADLVVCHGGFGTVMAALAYGRPLVMLPVQADQPLNAQMCAAQGAGLVLSPPELTPGALRDAVMEVLHNTTYRENAARIQTKMTALPGVDEAAGRIVQLARERHPQLATSV